jgi:hypothetical protein
MLIQLNDFGSFVARRFRGWLGRLSIALVFADKGIGILLLVEVAQRVVDSY